MGKYFRTICLLLLPLVPVLLSGQGTNSFLRISVEDGLSQGHVSNLLKDSDGLIWIGTQDGLNRYDGYQFRHFHHRDGDASSLSNNYIWSLLEDTRGGIWVGTFGGGLCRFDRITETFRTFLPTDAAVAENSIRSLCEWPAGTLWAGAGQGLWKMNLATQSFESFSLPELSLVTALHPLPDSVLLVGTAEGLLRLNVYDGSLRPIEFEGLHVTGATSIVETSDSIFWIGCSIGLLQTAYLTAQDSFILKKHFASQASLKNGIPFTLVNDLLPAKSNQLWVATNTGLSSLDLSNPEAGFTTFANDDGNVNSLSSNIVNCLAEIEPGLFWAGSREGINQFSTLPPPFRHLGFDENGTGLCANTVLGLTEDDYDNLWIATRNGLTRIGHFSHGTANWEFECLSPTTHPSMPYDYVINVARAEERALWVAFRRKGFARLSQNASGDWKFEP